MALSELASVYLSDLFYHHPLSPFIRGLPWCTGQAQPLSLPNSEFSIIIYQISQWESYLPAEISKHYKSGDLLLREQLLNIYWKLQCQLPGLLKNANLFLSFRFALVLLSVWSVFLCSQLGFFVCLFCFSVLEERGVHIHVFIILSYM